MKIDEAKRYIKAQLRLRVSDDMHRFQQGRLSLGRILEIIAGESLRLNKELGMLPPEYEYLEKIDGCKVGVLKKKKREWEQE